MTGRIVVFGGAGFAGLNIVEAALKRRRAVTVFDRADVPAAAKEAFAAHPGQLTCLQGDVRDATSVNAAIVDGTDAIVFGTAITANAARDASAPELVLNTNLMSLIPILERARDVGVRRVVNLSSVAAYGATGDRVKLLEETSPVDPQTLYAVSKFSTERVGERLGQLWGLDVVSVRLCSVFGPWEYATGMRDTLSPHLQVMLAAATGQAAVLPRPINRDWIYAPDMAEAVLTVLDAPRPAHRLYNIAPGQTWSILDFARAMEPAFPGFESRIGAPGEEITVDPHAPSDRAPLSAERMAQDFGWRAKTTMADAMSHYTAWWSVHGRRMMR
jgi:UDP-glucose 4-epimerase